MSVLVVGMSHRSAPVELLERTVASAPEVPKLLAAVGELPHVTEALVLTTCNRIEVYAAVDRFHGSVESLSTLLAERAVVEPESLVPHLYVHYDDGAVGHAFSVVAGLDSMVIGEGQILGQAREALRVGQEAGSVGPTLNTLFQQALRVGKRGHSETDIDRAAPSLVSHTMDQAAAWLGGLEGRRAVVVGAGAMASLAVSTLGTAGARVGVANRTRASAERLAGAYAADVVDLEDLAPALAAADLVVSCTGATGTVLGLEHFVGRDSEQPLAVVDLALPHDVEESVAALPGVRLVSLAALAATQEQRDNAAAADVARVREIVTEEVQAFTAARRAAAVTPTVVALRTMATGVVESELARLSGKQPDLTEAQVAEVRHTVQRVVDKLLHGPTVRVKELADTTGVSYATALAQLFALDPEAVDAVTDPKGGGAR